MLIGQGFDFHRLVEGKPLLIGGVKIPSERGTISHSDGDVLLHALIDAIFGASGLPDIGTHFPDTDPNYKGIASSKLLHEAMDEIRGINLLLFQMDTTIILEKPKLKEFIPKIRESLQNLTELPPKRIGLKTKTMEGIGIIGEGNGVACICIAMLKEKECYD